MTHGIEDETGLNGKKKKLVSENKLQQVAMALITFCCCGKNKQFC